MGLVGLVRGVPFLANKLAGVDLGTPGTSLRGADPPHWFRGWDPRRQYHCDPILYHNGGGAMSGLLTKVLINYPYLVAVLLFTIGTFTVLTDPNLFKKLLGINIMESAIFLMFVASGNIRGWARSAVRLTRRRCTLIRCLPL